MDRRDMIPVKVDQLFMSKVGFVVLLKGLEDKRVLQIFIGAAEAQAIAIQINGVEIPRPLTHDLLKNILETLDCRLVRIEICDLREGTFYARLILDRNGMALEMDCRPSDAIALALRCMAPIFVAEKVMDEAGRIVAAAKSEPKSAGAETKPSKEPPKRLSPVDVLKKDLDKAVQEERYEDAARLRDEIRRLENVPGGNLTGAAGS